MEVELNGKVIPPPDELTKMLPALSPFACKFQLDWILPLALTVTVPPFPVVELAISWRALVVVVEAEGPMLDAVLIVMLPALPETDDVLMETSLVALMLAGLKDVMMPAPLVVGAGEFLMSIKTLPPLPNVA